ncbi:MULTISPECIES: hypothetical protein [Arthrobacter]|uniref:Uncharacterized protein n=2 Tax=Arthrobacter TaxID=1663 RepID=A0ABU9KI79_9MICC|nr:hypothetical protein [Arthrobacter sp. YJM1]MDP5226384.1 hypothetical protein [Arthrobacter sp. YJM1]
MSQYPEQPEEQGERPEQPGVPQQPQVPPPPQYPPQYAPPQYTPPQYPPAQYPPQYPGPSQNYPPGPYKQGPPMHPPTPLYPQPGPKPMGGGIPGGLGVGCGLIFLAFLAALYLNGVSHSLLVTNLPSIVAFLIGGALMLTPRWRRFGAGILIMVCICWIVIVGPCTSLIHGSGTF